MADSLGLAQDEGLPRRQEEAHRRLLRGQPARGPGQAQLARHWPRRDSAGQ